MGPASGDDPGEHDKSESKRSEQLAVTTTTGSNDPTRLRTRRVWRSLNLIEIIDSDIIESATAAHFENLKRSYLGHLSTHSLTTWHSLRTRF